jgi:hypothetical protein
MLGDVVPLNSCAYVVSQSTTFNSTATPKTVTIRYNFEQWVMTVQTDYTSVPRTSKVATRMNFAK